MSITAISVVIAAASVVAASTFYSFQIRNQMRVRKTDLVMRLYDHFEYLYEVMATRAQEVPER